MAAGIVIYCLHTNYDCNNWLVTRDGRKGKLYLPQFATIMVILVVSGSLFVKLWKVVSYQPTWNYIHFNSAYCNIQFYLKIASYVY